jgi:hypothetical protein
MARLLWSAGIHYFTGNETLPGCILIRDEDRFRAKFPELVQSIPAMHSVNGVRLNGLPSEPHQLK